MYQLNRIRVACCLFTLFLGSIVYAADVGIGAQFFRVVRAIPGGDKVCHFLLMGTFSALANLSLRCRTIGGRSSAPGVGTVLVGAVVVAEEVSQLWVPGRNFDFFDLAADFLGIIFGAAAARKFSTGGARDK